MVGYPHRFRLRCTSVAPLPLRDVYPPNMADFPVGARHRMAFRPERLVLVRGSIQVLHLAHGFWRPLVGAVGKTVAPDLDLSKCLTGATDERPRLRPRRLETSRSRHGDAGGRSASRARCSGCSP